MPNGVAFWDFKRGAEVRSRQPIQRGQNSSLTLDAWGTALSVSGTSNLGRAVLPCAGADQPGARDFTAAILFTPTALDGYLAVGRWNSGASPSTCDWLLGAIGSFSGTTTDFSVACGSTVYTASVTAGWLANATYLLVGRRRGTTLTVTRMLVQYMGFPGDLSSMKTGSTTHAGITTINSNASLGLKLGEIDIGAGYNTSMRTSRLALWNRAISDAELLDLYTGRWPAVQSPLRLYFDGGGGGAAAQFSGAASAQADAAAQLTTAIPLSGAAAVVATAAGALVTGIPLSGQASVVSLADGMLTAQITLSGNSLAQAMGAAGITTGIPLAGASAALAESGGSLITQIRLDGSALAQALAGGNLSTIPAGLSGAASAQAIGAGNLLTEIPLTGAAKAYVTAAGGLTTILPLTGAAASVARASGDLTIEVAYTGAALVTALAGGDLTTVIRLDGAALARAAASGSLGGGSGLPAVIHHRVTAKARQWKVTATA